MYFGIPPSSYAGCTVTLPSARGWYHQPQGSHLAKQTVSTLGLDWQSILVALYSPESLSSHHFVD